MKRIMIPVVLLFFLFSCGQQDKSLKREEQAQQKKLPSPGIEKTELKETAIQSNEVNETTELEERSGILIVRFMLGESEGNKLRKLPNFRIKGPEDIVIDNSPSSIQKDAIHIFKLQTGRYRISSLYSINDKGEYEFDKPFPSNEFTVEAGKINYIGDIQVRMEEEKKSSNIYTRKLKLKLPADNDETIQIIKDRFNELLQKYPLERKIIHFR
jgi:hypothetical protein